MALAPAVRRCDTNETKRTNVPNVDVAFVAIAVVVLVAVVVADAVVAFCIFSVGYVW